MSCEWLQFSNQIYQSSLLCLWNLSHSQVCKQQQQQTPTKFMIPYVLLILSFLKTFDWWIHLYVVTDVALFFCSWLPTVSLPFYWTSPVFHWFLTLKSSYTKFSICIWNCTYIILFLFVYNVLVPNYLMWKYFYIAIELYLTYYFYFPGYFHVFSLPWGLLDSF